MADVLRSRKGAPMYDSHAMTGDITYRVEYWPPTGSVREWQDFTDRQAAMNLYHSLPHSARAEWFTLYRPRTEPRGATHWQVVWEGGSEEFATEAEAVTYWRTVPRWKCPNVRRVPGAFRWGTDRIRWRSPASDYVDTF